MLTQLFEGFRAFGTFLTGTFIARVLGGPAGLIVRLGTAVATLTQFNQSLQDSDSPGIRRLGETLEGISTGIGDLVRYAFPNFETFLRSI